MQRVAQLGRQDHVQVLALGVGGAGQQLVLIAVVHRRKIGDAGAHAQHPLTPAGRVARHVVRHFGARAHQAHRAAQHVDQLGQLIELVAPQPLARAGDAGIAGHRQLRRAAGLHRRHRAEFEDTKMVAAAPHPHLAEEHRPGRVQLDQQRQQQQQRRQQQQAGGGCHQIECPFAQTAHTAHALNRPAPPAPPGPRAAHRPRSCGNTSAG